MMTGRNWTDWAIDRIEADFTRSADTHLRQFPWLPCRISRFI